MSSELQKAINKLVEIRPGWKEFVPPPAKGAKEAVVGKGVPGGGGKSAGGGFDESDYTLRQYWPAVNLASSDGIFVVAVEPIKSIALTGNAQATFKEPV